MWTKTYFNSRPCERGFHTDRNPQLHLLISIHAPARGASGIQSSSRICELFQFTPLREGLPGKLEILPQQLNISIHAPARGASNMNLPEQPSISISSHAPARGASISMSIDRLLYCISIHAPARGASRCDLHGLLIFQFQFTPLREGLQYPVCEQVKRIGISIHAPARGASGEKTMMYINLLISIHAPARGASYLAYLNIIPNKFQFTPLREGLQQKSTIFLSVFCCFLFIKYIFQKLILSNSKFNQYRPYICAIFIAPISWDFMYGKYMRKIL